jgi:hypothetical protein
MHVGAALRQGRERSGEPKRAARHSEEREGDGKEGREEERKNNGPAISYTCLRRRIIRCGRQSRLDLIDQKNEEGVSQCV